MQAPRSALNGRFQFSSAFLYQEDALRWLAIDEQTGDKVVIQSVEATRVARFEAVKGFTHPHLGGIIDVARRLSPNVVPGGHIQPGTALVVAEYVPGRVLSEHLMSKGPINPDRAVAWWLRIADAVQAYHNAGGILGNISPYALLAKPRGRAVPPVLTQLTSPVLGATISPERLKGAPATPTDDVWALYACLYWALTGHPPFEGNSRDALTACVTTNRRKRLKEHGLDNAGLQEILDRGLAADVSRRSSSLKELVNYLTSWERQAPIPPLAPRPFAPRSLSGIVSGSLAPPGVSARIVFDLSSLPAQLGPEATAPTTVAVAEVTEAPAPPARAAEAPPAEARASQASTLSSLVSETAPAPRPVLAEPAIAASAQRRPSFNPFARKSSAAWPALIAVLLLGGVVAAFFLMDRRGEPPLAAAPAPTVEPPPASSPTHKIERRALSPEESLNACVSSYFVDDKFATGVNLGFVCAPGDLRETVEKLYELSEAQADLKEQRALDAGAPLPASSSLQVDTVKVDVAEQRMRRPLGWYELLATAVIRKGCCPSAAPVDLPETTGWCEQLEDVVRDLAEDSARSGDLAPRVKRFDKAVDCLFANKVKRPYPYSKNPIDEPSRNALQNFLSQAAMSDAKRRTLGR